MRFAILFLFLVGCGPMKVSTSIRIGSLNLANGAGPEYNTPEARAKQADFIRAHGLDIVGFQEVDYMMRRSGVVNTGAAATGLKEYETYHTTNDDGTYNPDLIATGLGGLSCVVFGTSLTFDANNCDVLDGSPCDTSGNARYGNAIYVRSGYGGPHSIYVKTVATKKFPHHEGYEQRSLVLTLVVIPDVTQLVVINTHLTIEGPDPVTVRREQLQVLADAAAAWARVGIPVVITGDFNASVAEVADVFYGSDLTLASPGGPDQIWTSRDITIRDDGVGEARRAGASDHEYMPWAELEFEHK